MFSTLPGQVEFREEGVRSVDDSGTRDGPTSTVNVRNEFEHQPGRITNKAKYQKS